MNKVSARSNAVFVSLCLAVLFFCFFIKISDLFDYFFGLSCWLFVASIFYFHRQFWKTHEMLYGKLALFLVGILIVRQVLHLIYGW